METKLSIKDKKAKQRYDDEVKLRANINKLLWEFSKKYDVECIDIGIARTNGMVGIMISIVLCIYYRLYGNSIIWLMKKIN